MRNSIVGLWRTNTDQFEEYIPYVYINGGWRPALIYVRDNDAWQMIGGAKTLMIPFITSDGDYFYTSDGKMFLVRNHA